MRRQDRWAPKLTVARGVSSLPTGGREEAHAAGAEREDGTRRAVEGRIRPSRSPVRRRRRSRPQRTATWVPPATRSDGNLLGYAARGDGMADAGTSARE